MTAYYNSQERQEEIRRLEAKLSLVQQRHDSDDGGLAIRPIDEVTIADFNTHAIALRNKDPLKYAAIQRQIMRDFVQSQMIKSVDFGVIPGTDKPGLYKAGAEKLADLFNLRIRVELTDSVQDWDKPLFSYDYKATILDSRGNILRECEANCNSWESKYRYRSVHKNYATEAEKQSAVGEKNGKLIVPNDKIFDQINTIKKMSQKRAIVGGVLLAVNASAFFGNMEAELRHEGDVPDDHAFWDVEGEIVESHTNPTSPIPTANHEAISAVTSWFNTPVETVKTIIKGLGRNSSTELTPNELTECQLQIMVASAMGSSAFDAPQHCRNSLNKLVTENPGATMPQIAELWQNKVNQKLADMEAP